MAGPGARMGRVAAVVGVLLCGISLAGCGSSGDTPSPPVDRTVDVYEGIVRWSITKLPAPSPDDAGKTPIVYVVAVNGDPLSADSQVAVVRDLKGDATVRFADRRDEAIDDGVDGDPVRDDGVLVLVGTVADGTGPVDVDVTLYRSAADEQALRLRLEQHADDWDVTSSTPI